MDFYEPGKTSQRRQAIMLPLKGTRRQPHGIIFHGGKPDKTQIQELGQKFLESQNVPKEEWDKILDMAEIMYEDRIKVANASREIRRRMEGQLPRLRKEGNKWVARRGHPLFTSRA